MRHSAKFRGDGQTIAEMAIFQFYKLAAAAILDLSCACLND